MEILRQVLAVLLVFGLLGGAVWALRRAQAGRLQVAPWLGRQGFSGRTKPPATLERLGRLALTPQHTLHMLRIQDREVVLVTHPQGCSVIQPATASVESRA